MGREGERRLRKTEREDNYAKNVQLVQRQGELNEENSPPPPPPHFQTFHSKLFTVRISSFTFNVSADTGCFQWKTR